LKRCALSDQPSPNQEPIVPDHESAASPETQSPKDTPVQAPHITAYDRVDDDARWPEEPEEELPRRPRRRILSPVPLALLGVLLVAAGFIGGVLVEKGQGSSSSSSGSAASLGSRFAALRGGAASSGSSAAAPGATSSSNPGFARPTAGTVAYLSGSTLYVTNSEGNTVKVSTSAGTSVTKTVKSTVSAIHPGETVTVTGAGGAGGTVSAESISVGSGGGGLASLFGEGGGSRSGAGGTGGTGRGGASSLFGSG
jgi:hypothetical protein